MIIYTMLCTCDGCGVEICKANPKPTDINSARWEMNDHLAQQGGIRRERMRLPTLHYCGKCADAGPKPKRKETK